MKVLPIQQNNYSQNNQQTSFKGVRLRSAMTQLNLPNNQTEWKFALRNLMRAVSEEQGLKINAPALFKGLKDSSNSTIDFTLYIKDAIMGEKPGTAAVLAEDSTGPLVTLAKTTDKQFIEFNDANSVVRFGLTEPMEDEKRHLFFQKPEVYIDYHDEFGKPAGRMRKFQDAFSDAKYFDRNGNREFGVGIRSLFKTIFG